MIIETVPCKHCGKGVEPESGRGHVKRTCWDCKKKLASKYAKAQYTRIKAKRVLGRLNAPGEVLRGRKRTGKHVICSICSKPSYKSKTALERNHTGIFYCSVKCQKIAQPNQQLARHLEQEWS